MKEITYRKRRNRKGRIMGVLAGMLVLAAIVVFGLFRVQEVVVSGNSIYTSKDIQNAVMQDGLCKNTLYLLWKYKDDSKVQEELPFLSSVEVTMQTPFRVEIRVYEKPEVGYFLSGTDYVYYDMDGLIVEISKKLRENIPKISGVSIKKPQRYEKLPVVETGVETEESTAEETKTGALFEEIVGISRILNKNGLSPKEIKFDEDQEIILYFEKMRVKLGSSSDMEEKIAALKSVYEKVKGMEGVLHMEDFTMDAQTITFKQGETEQALEVEQKDSLQDADADGDQKSESTESQGAETESETQTDGPVYTESDGSFSTDENGNRIYTDAAGNTTPNVGGYQYTDENGGIITDGYGYIDPYTGAYILK